MPFHVRNEIEDSMAIDLATVIAMRQRGYSRQEISDRVGLHPKYIDRVLRPLMADGIIKRTNARTTCTKPWTDERVDELRRMWVAGDSASQIAMALGGTTRNAVLGKVDRLGLASRAAPRWRKCRQPCDGAPVRSTKSRVAPKVAKASKPKSKPSPVAVALASEPLPARQPTDIIGKALLDLEPGDCRFPIGDPKHGEFGFCGCAKVPGTPYCLSHLRRCYTVSSVRPPAGTDDPEIIRQEPAHA